MIWREIQLPKLKLALLIISLLFITNNSHAYIITAVKTGNDPLSVAAGSTLSLSPGTHQIDLYLDTESAAINGWDILLMSTGSSQVTEGSGISSGNGALQSGGGYNEFDNGDLFDEISAALFLFTVTWMNSDSSDSLILTVDSNILNDLFNTEFLGEQTLASTGTTVIPVPPAMGLFLLGNMLLLLKYKRKVTK